MCDTKGTYSLSRDPYGGKPNMGKDGEKVCVLAYCFIQSHIICVLVMLHIK